MALRCTSLTVLRRLRHVNNAADRHTRSFMTSIDINMRNFSSSTSSDTSLPSPPIPSRVTSTTNTSRITTETEEKTNNASSTDNFIKRILQPDSSGQSPVLRLFGYYTCESKAIGAANIFYAQSRQRSSATVQNSFTQSKASEFVPQFEVLSLHIYLTLRRLRIENGSLHEADVKMAMQTFFDNFWTDVRHRMMIEEHKLSLLQSGKWIKQCEKNFFAMALALDEILDSTSQNRGVRKIDVDKLEICIHKHFASFRGDKSQVRAVIKYIQKERSRLEKLSIEQMWQGICWDPNFSPTFI